MECLRGNPDVHDGAGVDLHGVRDNAGHFHEAMQQWFLGCYKVHHFSDFLIRSINVLCCRDI